MLTVCVSMDVDGVQRPRSGKKGPPETTRNYVKASRVYLLFADTIPIKYSSDNGTVANYMSVIYSRV